MTHAVGRALMRAGCGVAISATLMLAWVPRSDAAYPVRCSSVSVSGATFKRVTITRAITCHWGTTVLKRWSHRAYSRRGVPDGRGNTWFCDFTRSVGGSSRRGDCIAGKEGGISFTLTYRQ